jgi:ComF family protein
MGSRIGEAWSDLVGLFLPRRCSACDDALMRTERALCLGCTLELPRNRFHDDPTNPVERLFHGRVRLQAASAFLKFGRGGMVQRMLHRLKYDGDREVGLELGRYMAEEAMTSVRFSDVDLALAVPLHPRKEHQRGYNQSQVLVDGMAEVWPLQASVDLLRVHRTPSQTRRGRMDRWDNVKHAFRLGEPGALAGKHVLLVDDVVTTGATIESCVRVLEEVPDVRISLLTCACA